MSAWEHLATKDYPPAFLLTPRSVSSLHEPAAKEMAEGMNRFATAGHEDEFAVVNDVAAAQLRDGRGLHETR